MMTSLSLSLVTWQATRPLAGDVAGVAPPLPLALAGDAAGARGAAGREGGAGAPLSAAAAQVSLLLRGLRDFASAYHAAGLRWSAAGEALPGAA